MTVNVPALKWNLDDVPWSKVQEGTEHTRYHLISDVNRNEAPPYTPRVRGILLQDVLIFIARTCEECEQCKAGSSQFYSEFRV